MFARIGGWEIHFARDYVTRMHGSQGAERLATGFEVWGLGWLLVVSAKSKLPAR
jgi:hypothetical protein